jgi:hypothetical protein
MTRLQALLRLGGWDTKEELKVKVLDILGASVQSESNTRKRDFANGLEAPIQHTLAASTDTVTGQVAKGKNAEIQKKLVTKETVTEGLKPEWDKKAAALRQDLEAFIKKNGLIDVHIYSVDEWRKRRESYGNRAILTMTFEGELYHVLNGSVKDHDKMRGQLDTISKKHGVFMELGFAWSGHFYPVDDRNPFEDDDKTQDMVGESNARKRDFANGLEAPVQHTVAASTDAITGQVAKGKNAEIQKKLVKSEASGSGASLGDTVDDVIEAWKKAKPHDRRAVVVAYRPYDSDIGLYSFDVSGNLTRNDHDNPWITEKASKREIAAVRSAISDGTLMIASRPLKTMGGHVNKANMEDAIKSIGIKVMHDATGAPLGGNDEITEANSEKRDISISVRTSDNISETKKFKSLSGARTYAQKWVGKHPEGGGGSATSGDGVARITFTGATFDELFPDEKEGEIQVDIDKGSYPMSRDIKTHTVTIKSQAALTALIKKTFAGLEKVHARIHMDLYNRPLVEIEWGSPHGVKPEKYIRLSFFDYPWSVSNPGKYQTKPETIKALADAGIKLNIDIQDRQVPYFDGVQNESRVVCPEGWERVEDGEIEKGLRNCSAELRFS